MTLVVPGNCDACYFLQFPVVRKHQQEILVVHTIGNSVMLVASEARLADLSLEFIILPETGARTTFQNYINFHIFQTTRPSLSRAKHIHRVYIFDVG